MKHLFPIALTLLLTACGSTAETDFPEPEPTCSEVPNQWGYCNVVEQAFGCDAGADVSDCRVVDTLPDGATTVCCPKPPPTYENPLSSVYCHAVDDPPSEDEWCDGGAIECQAGIALGTHAQTGCSVVDVLDDGTQRVCCGD